MGYSLAQKAMGITHTRLVHFDRLLARGPDAAVVVKLMMACNDLSLANQALADWKLEQPSDRKESQVGARMYFVRVELGHLYEGLKVIKEIQSTPSLMNLVGQCDKQTRDSFAELETFVLGGPKHREFYKLIGQLRDNLAFHYYQCEKLVLKAIASRASRPEARISSITRGSVARLWRFNVADDIIDSVVVRDIWSIPPSADLREAVDQVADRIHKVHMAFVDFSGEFIWKFCEE